MEAEIRTLDAGDAEALEQFLLPHRDSSMFLRANSRRAGLVYEGRAEQGTYVAAFRDGRIAGVVSHAWSGVLLLQAPDDAEGLAIRVVEASGRVVTGLSGPLAQVNRAMNALALHERPRLGKFDERLFALQLSDVMIPEALTSGAVVCRPPLPEERSLLADWRVHYDVESLGAEPNDEQRARSGRFLDAQIARGDAWVALAGGALVSLSAFNASLPDIVQLGGIYTPPAQRNRGYARAAVGAALLAARERGATRAVLFAKNPAAIRCYAAIGFQHIGEFGLVLFK